MYLYLAKTQVNIITFFNYFDLLVLYNVFLES